MKSVKRKILINACILSMLGCVGMGALGLDINLVKAESTLASLAVSKFEVRLPDAENNVEEGMRILLSVSEEDYQKFTQNENYKIGVLIAPQRKASAENLKFNEDGTLGADIVKYEYDRTYIPKLNETTGNYDFSVVLKEMPTLGYYTDAISAKAYVQTAENTYEYSEAQTNSMTGVVADLYTGLSDSLKEKVESYIVGGFCELTENYTIEDGEYTANKYISLEEIIEANAIPLSINEYGALLIGQEEVEDVYSSTVKITEYATELAEMFGAVSYESQDEGVTVDNNGKITATVRNLGGVDSNGNSLKNSVTVSFLGGALSSECEFVVLDETIRSASEFWANSTDDTNHVKIGENELYTNATTATMNDKALVGVDDLFFNNVLNNRRTAKAGSLYAVGATTEATNAVSKAADVYQKYVAYGGQGSIKEISYQGTGEVNPALSGTKHSPYFKLQMQFTKEQIAMMLALGYDTVKIPAYLEVADDENGLQSQALGFGTRNYVQLVSPISDAPATLNLRDRVGDTSNTIASSLFYVNTWQDILIPLEYVYKNYEALTLRPQTNTAGTEGHKALFGFENQLSKSIADANSTNYDSVSAAATEVAITNENFYRNFYFGNITVYKSDEVPATSLEASAVENIINLKSMQSLENLVASQYQPGNNAYNLLGNTVRRLGGLVNGAEINGKKGNFYNFTSSTSARRSYASQLNQNDYNSTTDLSVAVYYTIPCAKEYLKSLMDEGYTSLTFEMTYQNLVGLQNTGGSPNAYQTDEDGNVVTKTNSVKPAFYIAGSNTGDTSFTLDESSWTQLSIGLQWLYDNYDALNADKTSTSVAKTKALIHVKNKPDYPVTFYMGNFQLAK